MWRDCIWWHQVYLETNHTEDSRFQQKSPHYRPYYLLSFHPDAEGVKEMLAVRGGEVLDYQELPYCEYTWIGIFMDVYYNPQKYIVGDPQS